MGISELALLEVEEGTTLSQHLGQVLKACKRARDLTNQILAFSRQQEEEFILFSMKPVVKEALKLLESSLPSTIVIRHSIETDPGLIKGGPTQIHQVLMNLCTNAAHAMREKGGILEVKLRRLELRSGELTTRSDLHAGPYVCLSVSDTGYGITPEAMDRIFDPYFTTKGVGEGTGLGLAVVQGIVRKHKGAITVESEPGRGATFSVYLPGVEEEEQKIRAERPASLPRGNERILFVDDEEVLTQVGKDILESLGYEVSARTSSREALELFKAKPGYFDLVITDMNMPNMTGEQFARELMKIRPGMPIILCTGFSHVMSEENARRMGIRAYVMKPVVLMDLAETVRRVLDVKNPI
jgi:CheY-like chemotaxis protein